MEPGMLAAPPEPSHTGAVELSILVYRARQETFPKRAKWNEADAELFERG